MSVKGKVVSWLLAHEIKRIEARYEAAFWNNSRSYLPGFIQSAREDITAWARQEILRRVRYFEKNSTLLLKILGILDVNVVGSGITCTPATDNPSWNTEALDWWNEWVNVADFAGVSTLYELESQSYWAENVDGDSILRKRLNQFGRPSVELIEAHRMGPGGMSAKELGANSDDLVLVDGLIVIRKWLRPQAYVIADEFDRENVNIIPASEIVHCFRKKRACQFRGITPAHAAILDLHDLDDLQRYENRAAKDAATISKVIQTAGGAVPTDGVGSVIGAPLTQGPAVPPGVRATWYKQVIGGETIITQPGDKYEQFINNRPSAAMTGYWDKLERKVVQGFNLSYAALVDYSATESGSWGGAALRAAFQSDQRNYRKDTIRQAKYWQDVWEYAIGWAMAHGELRKNPQFRKTRWHPPRRASVDIGNESQAMLDELKAGVRTYESIYGELGDDWRERLEQRAKEEQFIEQLAKKYGVERQYIASFAQERLTGNAPDSVGTPDGAPGSNSPKKKQSAGGAQ